jgi:hypothetical protein
MKVSMQNSSHSSFQNPKSCSMFPCWTRWRQLNRSPHFSDVFWCSHICGTSGWFSLQCRSCCPYSLNPQQNRFRSGTLSWARKPKRVRNAFCVAVTDSPCLKKASTTKPRCSPNHGMADWKLYYVLYLTARTTPLYLLWGPHSDFSKCGSYFCRILYLRLSMCKV